MVSNKWLTLKNQWLDDSTMYSFVKDAMLLTDLLQESQHNVESAVL